MSPHGWILVVDDEPGVRAAIARWLQRHAGCSVVGCADRAGAVAALAARSTPPSAIVLDWQLGAETGGDVLLAIRASGVNAPCAFFSSHEGEAIESALLALRVDERVLAFQKPDLAPLLAWVVAGR